MLENTSFFNFDSKYRHEDAPKQPVVLDLASCTEQAMSLTLFEIAATLKWLIADQLDDFIYDTAAILFENAPPRIQRESWCTLTMCLRYHHNSGAYSDTQQVVFNALLDLWVALPAEPRGKVLLAFYAAELKREAREAREAAAEAHAAQDQPQPATTKAAKRRPAKAKSAAKRKKQPTKGDSIKWDANDIVELTPSTAGDIDSHADGGESDWDASDVVEVVASAILTEPSGELHDSALAHAG